MTASTTFSSGTVVSATWLNETDAAVYDDVFNVKRYGAVGDGVTDDTSAIAACITAAKLVNQPEVVIPTGTYLVSSTLTFDLPDGSTIRFVGEILTSVSNAAAVIIGKSSSNAYYYHVSGLKVRRSSIDYSGSSVGVELLNLAWANIDIRKVTNFRYGIKAHGNSNGFTYNNITLGMVHDNRLNLWLTVTDAAGGGYCNECNWYGGSFNHSSSYDVATYNGINLQIDHNATNVLNNHRFYGPSFEDAHASSSNTVAAVVNGQYIAIYNPRMERVSSPTTYEIQLTADSTYCTLHNGFSLLAAKINDLGTQNSWEAQDQVRIRRSTPNTSGKGVLRLGSVNTSAARCLLIEDSSGNEVAYITGEGNIYVPDTNKLRFVANGTSYANDADAAAGGIAVGQSYRNGSALQVRVV